ncbi:GNAT family N-acetyltransferase [Acidovorax sp. GBBC 3334]|uniref:GNAT family N-acetyltransferase n=1 Tax=unclassified Acidovorax TaxID=2684926 RepID=UPI002302FA69|nr:MULTISPECIES: GNAT family N-acetyltransferase [unclassified Acidovorax]MDA8457172.1 GNAT family N-acetyltransferase [Acidovorax sp. GBBC 3334]MDA8521566.1 GNAT family N-acetyltransferase [Acidovorax sp. NCPPB 4044]
MAMTGTENATAQWSTLPRNPPRFDTDRFMVLPLQPDKARDLLGVLLCDGKLAAQLPWMPDKSVDGARAEAFLAEMRCAAGTDLVWGIVERARGAYIGAVIVRDSLEGLDVEVLCASQFFGQGVADEAGEPVMAWLEEVVEVELV